MNSRSDESLPGLNSDETYAMENMSWCEMVFHNMNFYKNPFLHRDVRNNRAALFDGIEEGGIRASSLYSSHEIDEQDNERALEGLEDRVSLLKRVSFPASKLSGDINEEVDSHNLMLDRMGNDMDSSRGVLSGTMDRFKMVFETKSSRRMLTLVASFVVIFLIIYYLTRPQSSSKASSFELVWNNF
ncbi:hypothetical protein NC653_005407 [Populus alba x Populus x berolinensis]|uniref:t-SNARE coiled-coil homology domain-containing protein n=1 Tax=Populus alba x Populus x berolinensis TaxID=444605 RepID=A0AAD6WBC2_9ROSI|nr:hypothetical protein NC653_005407 [Populus alba x Populus x berolinensis]